MHIFPDPQNTAKCWGLTMHDGINCPNPADTQDDTSELYMHIVFSRFTAKVTGVLQLFTLQNVMNLRWWTNSSLKMFYLELNAP